MTIHPDFHRVSTRGATTGKKGWLSYMFAVCSRDSHFQTQDSDNWRWAEFRIQYGTLPQKNAKRNYSTPCLSEKVSALQNYQKQHFFLKDGKLIYRKRQEEKLLCLDCSWPLPLATN